MDKNYKIFTAKIEDGLKERLKIVAARTNITMQDLLNRFLKEGLDKIEKEIKN